MPRIHRLQNFIVAFALLTIVAADARANSVTIYDDRNAFIAASSLNPPLTFEGLVPAGGGINFNSNATVTLGGVTFKSAPDVLLELIHPSNNPLNWAYYTGSVSGETVLTVGPLGPTTQAVLNISLPGTYTAVGFDTNTTIDATVTALLSDGTTLTYTVPADPAIPTVGRFFGFTTTTGITSLRLTGVMLEPAPRTREMNIDDLRFGSVPEPSSIILIGVGLVGFAVKARKRARHV